MKRFAQLYAQLDATTSTNDKLAALQTYFDDVASTYPHDAAWALYFLAGGKPRQVVKTSLLKRWAQEAAGVPEWLFEESYQAVGDLAETIALVVPSGAQTSGNVGLSDWVARLLALKMQDEPTQSAYIKAWWHEMDALSRFLLIKLIGGGFRVGVSKLLVTRALAAYAKLDAKIMAQRLMGYADSKQLSSEALAVKFLALCAEDTPATHQNGLNSGQPYPFFLAHGLPPDTAANVSSLQTRLGDASDWQAEWKFDGIRAQIVKRESVNSSQVHIWSRGEELMNGRFPEIESIAVHLPDGTVLDGEILVIKNDQPQPFNLLQQRIGRKLLTKKVLADAPVGFMAYDLLEIGGQDIRAEPQHLRRLQLEALLATHCGLRISPVLQADNWAELAEQRSQSRARGVEGLMLKKKDSGYGQGRTKADGVWWKWKIDPLTVDGILIYAQAGHGRRASVYTDYTFAVWNRAPKDAAEAQAVIDAIERKEPFHSEALQLVAFAKAYSGLTDEEFKRVDAIIRKTTLEKFGPVRSVKPSLVFELGFEGINRSPRHKSGIAVRFPRMLRIRSDKPLHEANSLSDLGLLLNA